MAGSFAEQKIIKNEHCFRLENKIHGKETSLAGGTFLKKLRQFELSVLKILSVYYFLCGLYPWIMLLVLKMTIGLSLVPSARHASTTVKRVFS